jgi:hypothetical protein
MAPATPWQGMMGHASRAVAPPMAPEHSAMSPRLPSPDRLPQLIAEQVVKLVVDALDVNALIDRVDMNAVIDRVDINAIVERVDINAIVERVDIDEVIERVDINAIVERLDIEAILEHTELGSIIARSTSGVASEVLDVVRANGVTLDDALARWVNRLLRRRPGSLPVGPVLLVEAGPPTVEPSPGLVEHPVPAPTAGLPNDGPSANPVNGQGPAARPEPAAPAGPTDPRSPAVEQ